MPYSITALKSSFPFLLWHDPRSLACFLFHACAPLVSPLNLHPAHDFGYHKHFRSFAMRSWAMKSTVWTSEHPMRMTCMCCMHGLRRIQTGSGLSATLVYFHRFGLDFAYVGHEHTVPLCFQACIALFSISFSFQSYFKSMMHIAERHKVIAISAHNCLIKADWPRKTDFFGRIGGT